MRSSSCCGAQQIWLDEQRSNGQKLGPRRENAEMRMAKPAAVRNLLWWFLSVLG